MAQIFFPEFRLFMNSFLFLSSLFIVVFILETFSIVPIKRVGTFNVKEFEKCVYGNLTRNILFLNKNVMYCKRHLLDLR